MTQRPCLKIKINLKRVSHSGQKPGRPEFSERVQHFETVRLGFEKDDFECRGIEMHTEKRQVLLDTMHLIYRARVDFRFFSTDMSQLMKNEPSVESSTLCPR